MTYLQSRILANKVAKAIYAIRVANSQFTLSPSVYTQQALNLLESIKQKLNQQ